MSSSPKENGGANGAIVPASSWTSNFESTPNAASKAEATPSSTAAKTIERVSSTLSNALQKGSAVSGSASRQSEKTKDRIKTRRNSNAWLSEAEEEMLYGREIGVVFSCRARIKPDQVTERDCLTRVASKVSTGSKKVQHMPRTEVWHAWSSRLRLPCFTSTSAFANNMRKLFEWSTVFTVVWVLGGLSLEPACIAPSSGSTMTRLKHPITGLGMGSAIAFVHVVNAVMYSVLCFVNRIVVGRQDPKLKEELSTAKELVMSYSRSPGFWLDCVVCPGVIAEVAHLRETPEPLPTWSQWLMLLQLAKGWRLLLPEGSRVGQLDHFAVGLFRIFLSLFFFAHAAASILLVVAHQEKAWGQPSWLDNLPGEGRCMSLYVEATYFAILTLTSVGYGDMMWTSTERTVNGWVMLCAYIFTAKVCADLTWLVSTHNHWAAHHQALRAQTIVALQGLEVPEALQERVLAYQDYVASVHKEDLGQPAFSMLSGNLHSELRLCAYRNLVMQAPFLRNQCREVIARIVQDLRDFVYLPADLIVCCGTKGRDLYFVRRGRAGVFLGEMAPCWGESVEVKVYNSGDYFGELAMLTGRPRAAWIMAKTYTVCSVLEPRTIDTLSREQPRAFTTIVQAMVKVYNLSASTTWADVASRLIDRGLDCCEEAFAWFCQKGDIPDDEDLTAKAFEEGMRRLKVPELDRKIFWAEMDDDNSGIVDYDEFVAKLRSTPPFSIELKEETDKLLEDAQEPTSPEDKEKDSEAVVPRRRGGRGNTATTATRSSSFARASNSSTTGYLLRNRNPTKSQRLRRSFTSLTAGVPPAAGSEKVERTKTADRLELPVAKRKGRADSQVSMNSEGGDDSGDSDNTLGPAGFRRPQSKVTQGMLTELATNVKKIAPLASGSSQQRRHSSPTQSATRQNFEDVGNCRQNTQEGEPDVASAKEARLRRSFPAESQDEAMQLLRDLTQTVGRIEAFLLDQQVQQRSSRDRNTVHEQRTQTSSSERQQASVEDHLD